MPFFADVAFFRSVYDLRDLPPDVGTEIAFAGRSNAGKSTAINAIAERKRLAFVSKAPGRTQAINFFRVSAAHYFVDLPGYGYSAVPAAEKRNWERLISAYLQTREALRGLVLIMDVRHPFTPLDYQLLDWLAPLRKPVLVLLTKSDKLTQQMAAATLHTARKILGEYPYCAVQLFSGKGRVGIRAAQKTITGWWTQKTPG